MYGSFERSSSPKDAAVVEMTHPWMNALVIGSAYRSKVR
jgi:hypothetical protein